MKRGIFVRFLKTRGQCRFRFIGVLAFKRFNRAVFYFDEINFFWSICGCSPKVCLRVGLVQIVVFRPFNESKIFPNSADIFSRIQGREVTNQIITNAQIAKINFFAFFELIIQILCKRVATLNDKALFKKIYIVGDRVFTQTAFPRKAVIVNLSRARLS